MTADFGSVAPLGFYTPRAYDPSARGYDVVRHIPTKTKPERVWEWLTTPLDELEGMTPLEWIFSGRTHHTLVPLAKAIKA